MPAGLPGEAGQPAQHLPGRPLLGWAPKACACPGSCLPLPLLQSSTAPRPPFLMRPAPASAWDLVIPVQGQCQASFASPSRACVVYHCSSSEPTKHKAVGAGRHCQLTFWRSASCLLSCEICSCFSNNSFLAPSASALLVCREACALAKLLLRSNATAYPTSLTASVPAHDGVAVAPYLLANKQIWGMWPLPPASLALGLRILTNKDTSTLRTGQQC